MQQGQTQQQAGQRGQAPGARGQQAPGGRGGGGGGRGQVEIPEEFNATPIMGLDEPELLGILRNSSSSLFQKAIACKMLATKGSSASIEPLAALLDEDRLSHYARFGLEPNPDPAVDGVFREALGRLSGVHLIGVITSVGMRKDAQAVGPLSELLYNNDPAIAQASAGALAMIGGAEPARLLREALGRTQMPVFPVVARAALRCAADLADSNPDTARSLYEALSASNMPRSVRLNANRLLLALDSMATM